MLGRRPTAAAAAAAASLAFVAFAAPAGAQQSADEPSPPPTGTTGNTGPAEGMPALSAPQLRLTSVQTKALQRQVRVRADGAFGRNTRRALRRWEGRAGLESDGRPDTVVLNRMGITLTSAQAAKAVDPAAAAVRGASADASAPNVQAAIDAAKAQDGTPYSTGGEKPGGFDCSGLTSWAFKKAGITLPRTSFDQYGEGTAVKRGDIKAGDLVFFDSAGPGASDVGIAVSPTRTISATSHGVMEHATFDAYWGGHYVGARRVTPG